jgi:Co/Zn/Cd efflux system component
VHSEGQATLSLFKLPGMDCPAEEQLVRMALADLQGVASVTFDLDQRELVAVHREPAEQVLSALAVLGMGATLERSEPTDLDPSEAERMAAAHSGSERGALWAVLIINAAMFIVEMVAGVLAQSTGLIADSLDMLADASIYAIALLAVGGSAAGQRRAARTSGWLQLGLAGLVLLDVARRAAAGSQPLEATMVTVGVVALVANVTCLALLVAHRGAGAHMRASWIFTTNDVLANIGVILAGVLVGVTASALPDLLIGTAIALLVASGAWRILRAR